MAKTTKVKSKNAGTVEVKGGKTMETKDTKGFEDEQIITTFRNNERVKFKIGYAPEFKGTKHVPDGTEIDMHVFDAAIAEAMGKGKQVGDPYLGAKKGKK